MDPFSALQRHGLPLNAEVKSEELVSHFITPTDAIFHRNHDDIVQVPQDVAAVEEDWQLTITVEEDVLAATNGAVTWPQHLHARPKTLPSQSTVSKPLSPPHTMVSYGQLLRDKQVHRTHATATLECAGNRREALAEQGGKAEGIQWGAGAISTAHWYGEALRAAAGRESLVRCSSNRIALTQASHALVLPQDRPSGTCS